MHKQNKIILVIFNYIPKLNMVLESKVISNDNALN